MNRALVKTTKLLQGTYTIYKKISSGGFGIVYLAYTKTGYPVAIKEFYPVNFGERGNDNRIVFHDTKSEQKFNTGVLTFKEEAAIIMRMEHKNIIQIIDFFEENNTAYIVMPFEYGTTLGKYLKEKETFSEEEIIHFALEISSALQTVHKYNMVHLDLKPGNIWIRPNKEALLLDFGTAKILDNDFNKKIPAYTPGFAPPEQYKKYFQPKKIGPWCDYYGLGATLYYLIEKHAPPASISILEGTKHLTLLDDRAGQYNNDLLEVISALLNVNLEERQAITLDKIIFALNRIQPITKPEYFHFD